MDDARFLNRPVEELFGRHPAFGYAGTSVNTATGNFTHTAVDLTFGSGLLSWVRTYNSLSVDESVSGPRWTARLLARLAVHDGGVVKLHDGDGRVLTFAPDDEGGYRRAADFDADLRRDGDGRFTLRLPSGEARVFAPDGRLVALTAEGEEVTLRYDDSGRLAAATHSSGAGLTLSYADSGRLAAVEASDGRVVRYQYAADGELSAATAPGEVTVRYEPGRIVDADGNEVVANTYDGAGRVSRQVSAGAEPEVFAYDDDTGVTVVTGDDRRTEYHHDRAGHLVSVVDADGVAERSFDDDGRLVRLRTPGGVTLTQGYDERGNVLTQVVGGTTTSYAYDAANRVVRLTEPTGAVTRLSYTGDSRVPTSVTDATGATTRMTVVDGLVTEVTDPLGGTTAFEYDSARQLTTATDPGGRRTRYEYDSAGRRTAVEAPSGRSTRFTYDAAGRLTERTEPSGAVSRYAYTAGGRLLESADPTGATVSYGYDGAGRRVRSVDALGRATTFTYDTAGRLVAVTDPAGGTHRYTYDRSGRMSTATDPTGITVRHRYDADGRLVERVEPGGTFTFAYDTRGNVVSATDPAGSSTRYEYDDGNRLVLTVDAAGVNWRTTYDPAGRLLASTDPVGGTVRYEYDKAGRVIASFCPMGNMTRTVYDDAGRVARVIRPAGGVLRYEYDEDGHVIAETALTGLVSRFTYDDDGRLLTAVAPGDRVTRYEYSPAGRRVAATGPSGAVRRWEYDAAGQLVAAVDPNGGTARYAYDLAGNLTAATDAKGATTTYEYDAAGRRTAVTDPLGRATRYAYDGAANLGTVTEPSGDALRFSYDPVGQVVRRVGTDGTSVSYEYDAVGRRTAMTDPAGTTNYAYDLAGRLLGVTQPDGALFSMTYDVQGRRIGLQYPDGLLTSYRYNADGRLVWVNDARAGEIEYTVDVAGRLLRERLPGDWSRGYRYDDNGLLAGYRERHDDDTTVDTTFTRDAEGRISTQVDRHGTRRFTYDAAGQLLSASGGRGGTLRATYDAVGNRTSVTRDGDTTRYTYDGADQLIAADAADKDRDRAHVDYRYDPSGRLIERASREERLTIAYDGFGLPVTWKRSHKGTDQVRRATYDGDRKLSTVTTGPSEKDRTHARTVRYRWDNDPQLPQILVQQVDDDPMVNFVYGYGRALVTGTSTSATFSHDAFGTPLHTQQTAAWVDPPGSDPFGAPDDDQPWPSVPAFGFRGELTLAPFLHLRARLYDPVPGRFTSRDPAGAPIGSAMSLSPYTYADNDPVNLADPAGLFSIGGLASVIRAFIARLLKHSACGVRYCIGPPTVPGNMRGMNDEWAYKSRKPTFGDRRVDYEWRVKFDGCALSDYYNVGQCADWDDAVPAYRHYVVGGGKDFEFDFDEAYREDAVIRAGVDEELRVAQGDAETIHAATGQASFQMTGANNRRDENPATVNWQKALGKYNLWGSADVRVEGDRITMNITFHGVDRYNFNRNDVDIETGIPDSVHGKLEEAGLRHPFTQRGEMRREVSWTIGQAGTTTSSVKPPEGR